MNHRHIHSKTSIQRGTTLVETLVALLVLSIGLLGVAALQINALQTNQGAHVRSQASVLAYDIADRMRANRVSALETPTSGYTVLFGETPTGSTLNKVDLINWKLALTNTLPAGDGEVLLVGDIAIIRVRWTDRSVTHQFETRTRI